MHPNYEEFKPYLEQMNLKHFYGVCENTESLLLAKISSYVVASLNGSIHIL